jgi:hypothetical protein
VTFNLVWSPKNHSPRVNCKVDLAACSRMDQLASIYLTAYRAGLIVLLRSGLLVAAVAVLNVGWRILIVPRFVSVNLSGVDPFFIQLKFVACPLMAFLIFRQDYYLAARLVAGTDYHPQRAPTTEDIATALRESTTASSKVDRRVDLVSLQLGQETTNYAFHKCIVEGLPREPASVKERRDD